MEDTLKIIKQSFELKNQKLYKEAIETLYKVLAEETDTKTTIEVISQIGDLHILLKNPQRAIEHYFRDLEYNVCKKISKMNDQVVSTGGGTMTYERNIQTIKQGSIVFFLDSSFSVICDRIGKSDTRPLFQDKIKAKKLYDERKKKYEKSADYIIEADGTVEEVTKKIIDKLMN